MPAVDPQTHLSATQGPLRHESPDIIDVDAFDADDIVYVGSARPLQRRRVAEDGRAVPVDREVIHIVDNEDDNEVQFIGHNPARPRAPSVRRERIFSPPPPPQIGGIPPVPQIPQRFLALRGRPAPGPIIPNGDPFPFEDDLRPPMEQAVPVAAAPSHHVPTMGFGGALLAGYRRIIGPRNISHRPEHRNGWVTSSIVLRWHPREFGDGEDDLPDGIDDVGFFDEDENAFAARRVRIQMERAFKRRDREIQAGPDYKPEYTHPDRPYPGFTYDFSPSSPTFGDQEDSSSENRSCSVTLICASCRDPLILGASDVGEDRAKRKLWGLRCGHLLDGKCIELLMEPGPTSDEVGSSGTKISVASLEHPPLPSQDSMVVESDVDSMRSRLRPRRGTSGSLGSSSHPALATSSGGRRGGQTRGLGPHRSNRKGKEKMKVPMVEAEHEWSCPVSGCGRSHLSLLMDGRWTMDEKRGAVAVFV